MIAGRSQGFFPVKEQCPILEKGGRPKLADGAQPSKTRKLLYQNGWLSAIRNIR